MEKDEDQAIGRKAFEIDREKQRGRKTESKGNGHKDIFSSVKKARTLKKHRRSIQNHLSIFLAVIRKERCLPYLCILVSYTSATESLPSSVYGWL